MTIQRADVEALLATVEQVHKPNHGVIAELCRTWLAVDSAPTIEMPERKGPAHAGPSLTISTQAAERMGCAGKRVRLVAQDSGGAGEVGCG